MAARLPDGATLALATTYGSVKDMTAVSNASTAEATFEASHGVTEGDFIEVTSGWGGLNERVVKAGTVDTNDVLLSGINTVDTARFPAGAGIGSIREITAFTPILQVMGFTTNGGEPTQVEYEFLEDDFTRSLPGPSGAQTLTLQIADDPSLAGYIALKAASDDASLRCLKMTLKDGSVILYNGKVHLNETPSVEKRQVMRVTATFYLQAKPMRYAA